MLLPHNQTNAIPQILEDMREMLCRFDIQSRTIRKYFQRYLYQRTDHFIHEFYNFAISAYDIVGYDRHVDYNARVQSTSTTVEISDNSDDDDVQVVEEAPPNSSTPPEIPPVTATSVVMETSCDQQENCIFTEVATITELDPLQNLEVLGTSSSECEFVLALKPPHLRTPEMLSLDSASDSDVVFIPNPPEVISRVDSSTTDSDDNKPLATTMLKLKTEIQELNKDKESVENILEPEIQIDTFNLGASTSKQLMGNEQLGKSESTKVKKIYFAPKRKRIALKNVFEKSSSDSESKSDQSDKSGSESYKSKRKRKREAEKKLKLKRISSAKNQKPLSLLPSTEETKTDSDSESQPRLKSVIIMKNNQHYIKRKSSQSELSEN